MAIGTSMGAYYDDEHHLAAAEWDPHKYDPNRSEFQKNIDNKIKDAAYDDVDQDLIRNPIETQTGDTENNVLDADKVMQNRTMGNDPRNIYDDSGNIVDYDLKLPPALQQQHMNVIPTDPNDMTGQFNTQLNSQESADYSTKFKPGDSYDYDMQGWYKANPNADPNADGVHYPDTYKKPNHPTFSDQSQYSNDQTPGGHWEQQEDKSYSFTPGSTNMKYHDAEELKDYFSKVEPNNNLSPNE